MPRIDRIRRGVVAAALVGTAGVGLGSDARSYLREFAPLSGDVWAAARSSPPDSVTSPYGDATVRYDGYGVPTIEASTEGALYYAVGYVHATDRLFQLDLQRRQMRGQLSAVVGDVTLDSDRFHVAMDFAGAAEATWAAVQGTPTGDLVEAYAKGVNAARAAETLPVEFQLLDYEPAPWTPEDTMLMEKQISWNLTGSFRTLRVATVADAFGSAVADALFPTLLDHDSPIIRDGPYGGRQPVSRTAGSSSRAGSAVETANHTAEPDDYGALLDWIGAFEPDPGIGSNSWVVSGDYTKSGSPILCNDPHLTLMAPPVWYQQHVTWADGWARGVTFPGVPFVVIGQNHAGAWGFTNTGADVLDLYRYETEGDQYKYRGEWKPFEETTHTIEVAGGNTVDVTVRKTVHGPLIEREGQQVAVAWTGLSATDTTQAVHAMNRSGGLEGFLTALRSFDEPTQNVVYADRDGHTLYYTTGRIPIRTVGGTEVRGDRVFDGSSGVGEWSGFTPYGRSTWEGFVPFDEKPHVIDPGYVATANQRVTDHPQHFVGQGYAPPFRGMRIYELLDSMTGAGPVDAGDMRTVQRDVLDKRAEMLVPRLLKLAERVQGSAKSALDALDGWDYRMTVDSHPALVFAHWFEAYRHELYHDAYAAAGLGPDHYPNDWITVTLTADSPWFDVPKAPADPTSAMVAALDRAVNAIDAGDATVYGEYNTLTINHPFDQSFLNYPRMPVNGSSATVKNYRRNEAVGSSWRQVVPIGGDATVILPGGNDGDPFSVHYHDQLADWAAGRYLPFDRPLPNSPTIRFTGGAGS